MAIRQLIQFRELPICIGQNVFTRQQIFHKPLKVNKQSSNYKYFRSVKSQPREEIYSKKPSIGGSSGNVSQKSLVPTFLERLANQNGSVDPFRLWRPVIFTIAFGTGSFIGASIWEYEKLRARSLRSIKNSINFSWFRNKLHNGQKKAQGWKQDVDTWWNRLSPGEKVFAPICAINLVVFALWRVPRFQPGMIKYFCSNPAGKAICWPMFLSTFSHYSTFHILANMYVLYTFSNAAVAALGPEQFFGLYLSAGVISSLASYFYKVGMVQAGLSLGASGAIMAILALVCASFPDLQLSIIFLPMFTFSAGTAIKCIMGIDLAGVIMGWKVFDHAAHLGGALFGLFWCYYGSNYLWPKREYFLQQYHKLRSTNK